MGLMRLIGKRLLLIPISLFILVSLSFLLLELMPGNPAITIAGDFASDAEIEKIEESLGLNDPLGARYLSYLGSVVRGDLGRSFFSDQPVLGELRERLPATMELVFLSLIVAAIVGLFLGVLGAYYRGRKVDKATRGTVTLFQSIPDFLMALLLIFFLFYLWSVAPAPVGRLGFSGVSVEPITGFLLVDTLVAGDLNAFVLAGQHLLLPVLALGIVYAAYFGKTARSTMATALDSTQVEFARACGLSEWKVVYYAFLQARTPILTYGAILFGALIGGAAIIETIFSWPGAGSWALTAILSLDIPVIQGFILAAGFVTITVFLLLDVLILLLDPRVRL
ncbi:MAG: ABC transporter permease [Candidatus Nanopelagicales bacterium]|jgi:ABC-type dipeptide/oligopeptide/nickel transport system permease component|nr:ABC transporter permease [Candidatus Nanopelagicales bacterium]